MGVAGAAELHPGVEADWSVLAVGFAATVLVVVATSVAVTWVADRRRPPVRRARLTPVAAGLGLSPAAAAGLRFALRPDRGRRAVPVRSALSAVGLGVLVVVTVFAVTDSFDAVRDDPARYGVYWDASAGNFASPQAAAAGADVLDQNPDVAAYAGQALNELDLDGDLITGITIFPGAGRSNRWWWMGVPRTEPTKSRSAVGSCVGTASSSATRCRLRWAVRRRR